MKKICKSTLKVRTIEDYRTLADIAHSYCGVLPIKTNPDNLSVTIGHEDKTNPDRDALFYDIWRTDVVYEMDYTERYAETFRYQNYEQLVDVLRKVRLLDIQDFSLDYLNCTMTFATVEESKIIRLKDKVEKILAILEKVA